MAPATPGALLTVIVREDGLPFPQLLVGVTEIVPPAVPKVTVILLVLAPDVMVAPAGTVQLYPAAPATGEIE
jgi:hypothetical protein